MVRVKIRKCRTGAKVPQYMSTLASGCDVTACVDGPVTVAAMERIAVPTGLQVEIPPGYEIQVRPRSGLSWKKGLTVVNAPGTIDADYRGEINVLMINLSKDSLVIEPGDRIAQLILQKVEQIEWSEAEELSSTQRAEGGFGSTGVNRPATT